jgi:hypothetical protein
MIMGWLIACLVLGAIVACWWAYFKGSAQGYYQGYTAGQKAQHRSTMQKVNAVKERGQAAEATIEYLYERARAEIEQLDPHTIPPDGSKRP